MTHHALARDLPVLAWLHLAEATLGAIVLVAVAGLVDTTAIRRIVAVRRRDGLLAVAAVAGICLFGLLDGIVLAVVLSLGSLIWGVDHLPLRRLGRQASTGAWREMEVHEGLEAPAAGLLVVRVEGPLYFANARRVVARLIELRRQSRRRACSLSTAPRAPTGR